MESKIYRCGYCGCPTKSDGQPHDTDTTKRLINIIESHKTEADKHTHLVHGYCCIYDNNRDNMVQVTRDMAKDACDLSLEGQWIKW